MEKLSDNEFTKVMRQRLHNLEHSRSENEMNLLTELTGIPITNELATSKTKKEYKKERKTMKKKL